jgi:hypothetical protein
VTTWLKYFLSGALAFWGPAVLWAALLRRPIEDSWRVYDPLMAFSLCLCYLLILNRASRSSGPSISGSMLLGIYILGPWLLLLEATLSGGGIRGELVTFRWWWLLYLLYSLVPPYTLILSGYDVTIFALLFVTVFLLFAHFKWERERWVYPFRRQRNTGTHRTGGRPFEESERF